MTKIFKYDITGLIQATSPGTRPIVVDMPIKAKIRKVGIQKISGMQKICIWAEVDPKEQKREDRFIEYFMTGQDIPTDMGGARKYLDTLLVAEDTFVLHIYERIN